MTPGLIAGVLATVVLMAGVRQARRSARRGEAGWRRAVLLAGQVVLAVLLYFFLLPPTRPGSDATLVVLTADAPRPAAAAARVVALPEASPVAGVVRVPDLGTALRRHPDVRTLRVLGAGLTDRDRDAARGLALVFEPAPLPAGLVALQAPTRVPAGRRFGVRGQVHGGAGSRMELLDPAGKRADLQPVGDDGRFELAANAGPAGRVAWRLQRRDGADAVVETVELPVQVEPGAPLRVLSLAGGVNPENKYLRRWALDAGLALRSQASVGGGVDVGAAPPPLTVAGLRDTDLVVLDDRAWRALGDGGRAQLREAVRDGVGLVLRLTADPGEADRRTLRAWGFDVAAADIPRSVSLPGTGIADDATTPGPQDDVDVAAADRAPVLLSRRAVSIAAADGVPLLLAADGRPLALWRAEGRGRIALWNLSDSFRLLLAGRRAAYGSLWADAAGTLARGRGESPPERSTDARAGERLVLCGLREGATLHAPDGTVRPLPIDPATGARACAAAWPETAGWHEVHDAGAIAAFPVRGADEAPGLARAALRDATSALAARAAPVRPAAAAPSLPGARWPWLLAYLFVAGALWGLERARVGIAR